MAMSKGCLAIEIGERSSETPDNPSKAYNISRYSSPVNCLGCAIKSLESSIKETDRSIRLSVAEEYVPRRRSSIVRAVRV